MTNGQLAIMGFVGLIAFFAGWGIIDPTYPPKKVRLWLERLGFGLFSTGAIAVCAAIVTGLIKNNIWP